MKKPVLSAGLLLGILTLASAGPIQTALILPGNPTLTVTVPSGQVLRILNFVHTNISPGAAVATINAQTANVMQSVSYGTQETHVPMNLAGPATLTVNSPSVGALTISYKVDATK